MDYNYRAVALLHNLPVDKQSSNLDAFPIEQARSRFCQPLLLLSIACTIGYGWSIHTRTHVSVPLILQFFIGFLATWILNVFNALLVDVYPDTPSAAATAGNLWRCGMSAGAVATIDPLYKAIGIGWFFTIAGILSGGFGILAVWVLNERGMAWRNKRTAKEKREDGANVGGSAKACDIERGQEKQSTQECLRNDISRTPSNPDSQAKLPDPKHGFPRPV
jgi:hypothetical protein